MPDYFQAGLWQRQNLRKTRVQREQNPEQNGEQKDSSPAGSRGPGCFGDVGDASNVSD